jgi:hypothetical protein
MNRREFFKFTGVGVVTVQTATVPVTVELLYIMGIKREAHWRCELTRLVVNIPLLEWYAITRDKWVRKLWHSSNFVNN